MKTILAAMIGLAAVAAAGCKSHEKDKDVGAPYVTTPPSQQEINVSKLQTVPPLVRIAFFRDYPDAGIVNIQQKTAATGLLIYEINFLQNGRPGQVIYAGDGTVIPPAAAGRPAGVSPAAPAAPPPATQPGMR